MNEKRRPQGRNFPPRPAQAAPAEETEGQLEGRNALQEALRSGRTIDKVFIADGDTDRGLQRLAAEAKDAGAVVVSVDRRKLDAMSFTHAHQGVIALAAAHAYFTVDDILEEAASLGEAPLIVICDELSDPHNLGAVIRTAECAGAHGVVIPKRRSAGVHQFIISPVEEHSKKPEEARRRIVELMGDLPRIELFARQKADGWDVWGNEVACDIALTGGEPNVG